MNRTNDANNQNNYDMIEEYENIIHDLREPLTIMYTYIQLLERQKKLPQKAYDQIAAIKKACFKSIKMINDMNDSSKLSRGGMKISFANVNMIEVLDSLISLVEPFLVKKQINLNFINEADAREKVMATDKALIERVILNLISNSVKSTPYGGTIDLKFIDKTDDVEIIIEDNGNGISEEFIGHVFERYRTSNSLRGTGIGLYIVKEIVSNMGGSISVHSKIGEGTRMTISLPVTVLEDNEEKAKLYDDFYLDNMVQIEFASEYY